MHACPLQLEKERHPKMISWYNEIIDSKTVLPSSNTTDPRVSLLLSKDLDCYKLYIADTGLFITLMFMDRPVAENEIYAKLLSDKLPANLWYLYENLIAQMITASGRELYYHTWEKEDSTHYYEIDFLISQGAKVSANLSHSIFVSVESKNVLYQAGRQDKSSSRGGRREGQSAENADRFFQQT